MSILKQLLQAVVIIVVSPTVGFGTVFVLEQMRIITPSNFPKGLYFFSVIALTCGTAFVLRSLGSNAVETESTSEK